MLDIGPRSWEEDGKVLVVYVHGGAYTLSLTDRGPEGWTQGGGKGSADW